MALKLKKPLNIKERLLKMQLATHRDIAHRFGMSTHTVAKLLDGEPVRPATIKRVASELGMELSEIATFAD